MEEIAARVARIKEEIAKAARRAGTPDAFLLAATKTRTAPEIACAIAAGVDACGENRVQELVRKQAQDAYKGAPVHFIGRLQKNKVKQVVGAVGLIESVDSLSLMELIDARAAVLDLVQDILLEINIGDEPQKGGFLPGGLDDALAYAARLSHLRVRGLMTVPPAATENGGNRVYFRAMRQLFIDTQSKKYDNIRMDTLSMGMSVDYLDAVEEGATLVRVGTAIFGPRRGHNYTT